MGSWSTDPTSDSGQHAQRRLTPMTMGDVLDGMFRLLISHWRVYLLALGVLLVPYYLVYGWASFDAGGMFDAMSNPTLTETGATTVPTSPVSGVVGLLALVATIFVTPMTLGLGTRIAAEAFEGGTPTFGGVWRSSLGKFWALLGLMLLVVLATVAVVVVPALAIAPVVAADLPALVAVLVVVMIAGVFFVYTKLSLSVAAVIVERTGPLAGMRRSWQLTKGRFWRVLGTLVLTYIIVMVVFGLFVAASAVIGAPFGPGVAVVLGAIAYLLGGVLITPLLTNVLTLLYYDGRIRREGYDLDVLTQEVTGDPSAGPAFG